MPISSVGGVFLALALCIAPDQVDTGDAAKLQGRWTVVFYEEAGASLSADITKQLIATGQAVRTGGPDELAKTLRQQAAQAATVAKALGLKAGR